MQISEQEKLFQSRMARRKQIKERHSKPKDMDYFETKYRKELQERQLKLQERERQK